jgi:hypothetical protein
MEVQGVAQDDFRDIGGGRIVEVELEPVGCALDRSPRPALWRTCAGPVGDRSDVRTSSKAVLRGSRSSNF